jgi:hypothetical protein
MRPGCCIAAALGLTLRFFHKMAQAPPYPSAFPNAKIPNVVPEAFEGTWQERVDEWGGYMKQA